VSDPKSEPTDPVLGDPEGEWNDVVRRISDRIRRKSNGGTTTQSGLDVAGELVRLERRAREAEASLERERGAYAMRVQEMEEKLKKVEPWLRQLKSEYQKASAERDRLRDELSRGTRSGSPETVAVEPDDRSRMGTLLEAEAARAERDAALAEAESLRKRIESQRSNTDPSAELRIAAAEKARDEAAEDLKQLRRTTGDGRRADEEVRRLQKQVEQLETSTSVHKAVARAAQETADQFATRVGELEKAVQEAQAKADAAQQHEQRVRELTSKLEEAGIELVAVRRKLADAERASAARAKGRGDGAAGGDAAELKELADEAMRAEQEARARADDLAKRLAAAERQIADAAARAKSVESEVTSGALALEEQARDAARRYESAEASFRSQMRAAEARFEMDLHRERENARSAEEVAHVLEERNARVLDDAAAELTRLRAAAMQLVSAKAQELVLGMQRIVGEEPVVVPPITMSLENPRTPTATVVVPPAAGPDASPAVAGEWDKLMSDVEQLCSEVKDIRQETGAVPAQKPADTDSVSVEVAAPGSAPSAESPSAEGDSENPTQPEPEVDPEAMTIEMSPPSVAKAADEGGGTSGRKKRR
jgi:archaellum component FlaC